MPVPTLTLPKWNAPTKLKFIICLAFATASTLIYLGSTNYHHLGQLDLQSHFDTFWSTFQPSHTSTSQSRQPWDLPDYPPDQPRIILMQHFSLLDPRVYNLQNISLEQHERYTQYWGYGLHVTQAKYVPDDRDVRERQMNKLYALLELGLRELALGERGAEWIYITDADVLIRSPTIPIHALIPPFSDALIVGTSDFNGFNSGNMLYRISLDFIAYLAQALSIADRQYRAYHAYLAANNGSSDGWDELDLPTSDQRALCRVLEEIPDYAERFYQYPERWLNSYATDVDQEGIQVNTHMVAGMKYWEDLTGLLESEKDGWEMMGRWTEQEVKEQVEEVREKARRHWEGEGRKTGVPHCIWMR